MRRKLLALACCLAPSLIVAAPRPPDRGDPYARMSPEALFKWAMNAPLRDKPWRVVLRIEMAQKDPVEWGWNVNSALETAIANRFPKCQGITYWQAWIQCQGNREPMIEGAVAITIWHLRATDGELEELDGSGW